MSATRWTKEELQLARDLRSRRAKEHEYITQLGRTRSAAYNRLYVIDYEAKATAARKAHSEKLRIERAAAGGSPIVKIKHVPDDVIMEAQNRREAPHTLTSFIFGDPPIGYRALDRKRDQETA